MLVGVRLAQAARAEERRGHTQPGAPSGLRVALLAWQGGLHE